MASAGAAILVVLSTWKLFGLVAAKMRMAATKARRKITTVSSIGSNDDMTCSFARHIQGSEGEAACDGGEFATGLNFGVSEARGKDAAHGWDKA